MILQHFIVHIIQQFCNWQTVWNISFFFFPFLLFLKKILVSFQFFYHFYSFFQAQAYILFDFWCWLVIARELKAKMNTDEELSLPRFLISLFWHIRYTFHELILSNVGYMEGKWENKWWLWIWLCLWVQIFIIMFPS